MGIEWICTARPREGHEAEYARLRVVALAELDPLEGLDSANWYAERHGLDGEELAAVLRLHEISVYPGETWKAFLGELWDDARETARQRDDIPLPEEDRALLALPEIQEVLASLATRFEADVQFPDQLQNHTHNYLRDLLGDCRWRLTRFTSRELHLLRIGWDHGYVWRRYDLAPGMYDGGFVPARGATAEEARAAARHTQERVCEALRRIVPALRSLDDAGIEAEFARWSEFRWRVSEGMLECCPIEQPAWVDTLDELPLRGPGGEKDPALFSFVRHSVEKAVDAFGTARWMEFWGSRGHGFVVG